MTPKNKSKLTAFTAMITMAIFGLLVISVISGPIAQTMEKPNCALAAECQYVEGVNWAYYVTPIVGLIAIVNLLLAQHYNDKSNLDEDDVNRTSD